MLNYHPEKIMKCKFGHILAIIYIIGLFAILTGAEKIFCDQCENLIKEGSSYLVSNGKIFCDEECYEKSLPKCAVCSKPVKKGFTINGKNYCSEKCLSTTWGKCSVCGKRVKNGMHFGSKDGVFYCLECSKKTVCFACGLPNDCSVLDDGRTICAKCKKTSIKSFREAMNIIRDVRKTMKGKLNISTDHNIKYELVNQHTLKSISKNSEMELGLFAHEEWKNTETTYKSRLGFKYGEETKVELTDSFYIYILTDIPKDKFIEITAHELAHDWMEKVYPNIKDLKITEGWSEFAASQVNSIYKNGYLNIRMEENNNPVYGDGYRFIADYVKQNRMEGLYKLFEKLNGTK